MNKRLNTSKQVVTTLAALAIATWAANSLADNPVISQTYDTDLAGWGLNYSTGPATVTWNPTNGWDPVNLTIGGGCVQITLTSGGSKVGPLCQLPAGFKTADYWKYEFDMMIDPNSGLDGNGTYGNFQTVLRDASWSWDSHWFGGLDSRYNSYQHVSVIIPSTMAKTEDKVAFEIAAGAGTYSGDLIIYLDNLTVTPMFNPWLMHPFTNQVEITSGFSSWSGGHALGATATLDTSKDAGGGQTPVGSLRLDADYDPSTNSWQEATIQFDWTPSASGIQHFDPTRYSSFDFDVWIDPSDVNTAGGVIALFLRPASGGWSTVGSVSPNSSYYGKWTHVSIPMGSVTVSDAIGFVLQNGGGTLAPMTYYFDNIKFVKQVTAPTIKKLADGTPAGVQVLMDNDNSQWQRDGISTPQDMWSLFWASEVDNEPISYSFTLNNFPPAAKNHGFEAHMFMVNLDTDPSASGDGSNGSVDWNAANVIVLNVTGNANGNYDFALNIKTNLPSGNPQFTVATVSSPTAIGTWGIKFTTLTNAVMTGPGGISTNIVLDADMVNTYFNPGTALLHFGMFKNDGTPDHHNDGVSGTFSRLTKTGGSYTFDDTFTAGLTNNYAWRASSATAVSWVPPGVAKWLWWSLPADRYIPQVSSSVLGPWTDITGVVTNSTSTLRVSGIPAAAIPAGPAAYFRLVQHN